MQLYGYSEVPDLFVPLSKEQLGEEGEEGEAFAMYPGLSALIVTNQLWSRQLLWGSRSQGFAVRALCRSAPTLGAAT